MAIGYFGPVSGYLAQRSELRDESAKLAVLERSRDAYRRQIRDLDKADVLEARARALGLIKPGERAFIVRGDLEPPPPAEGRDDDGGPLRWITGVF